MNHEELKNHIDGRLDRIENKIDKQDGKLDDHLERISRAEEAVVWMKGHLQVVTGIVISMVSAVIAGYFKYFHDK